MDSKAILKSTLARTCHYSRFAKIFSPGPNWRILMYHRVIKREDVPYPIQDGMYVTPEAFASHAQFLARDVSVVSLDELAEQITSGVHPRRKTVAITFDDGWLDFYQNAFPVLKQLRLPATLFLPTSYIGTTQLFWSDELAEAVQALRTESRFAKQAAERIKENDKVDPALAEKIEKLLLTPDSSLLPSLLEEAIFLLKTVTRDERRGTVREVATLAKEYSSYKRERAFVNWAEVKEMSSTGIKIGSHSHSHRNLTELGKEELNDDIQNSLQTLRSHDLSISSVFCYPGGQQNELTAEVLRENEFRYALAADRTTSLTSDPCLFGRIGIHQDIAHSIALFNCRMWLSNTF